MMYVDGRSYSCQSRPGARAGSVKPKPLSPPGCALLVQDLSLKKPFFYAERKRREGSDGDDKSDCV